MHILITGGAGFIGSQLVEYHLNKSDVVHAIDDLSTGSEDNIRPFLDNPNFRFTQADILTYPDIEKITCWADRIYHMAAVVGIFRVLKEPEKVLAINIGATERLLRAVKASNWKPRILIASTSEVYGDTNKKGSACEETQLTISSDVNNRSTYSISKIAAESFGLSYYRRFNIPITILRLFNTIGPRQTGKYGMVVPRFVNSAVKNEPLVVYGTGDQTRSFIDVRDSVALMDEIANNPQTIGQIINLGNDHEVSINTLATLVKKLAKSHSEINYISYEEAYGEDFEDIMFRKPDLIKLRQETHYNYQWSLEKTLIDLINDARSRSIPKKL